MSPLVIGVLVLALGLICAISTVRARQSPNRLVRWVGAILAGLLALVFLVFGGIDLLGVYWLEAPRANPVPEVKVVANADQLARGEHLAHLCASCHSTTGDLPLDGGATSLISSPDGSGLGTLYAPNLTPGGPLRDWSDGEIIRAIREGIARDGHALIIMPSDQFHQMSDADVQAIVAYLRTQPALMRATPPRTINLIGTFLIGAGLFPTSAQPPVAEPVVAPPLADSTDYGRYLVAISGCRVCHGQDLSGGRPGAGPPVGPNLTLIVPRWSETDFVTTIRTGVDPTGYPLAAGMPWRQFSAAYSNDELKAMYTYLHGLKPISSAVRAR